MLAMGCENVIRGSDGLTRRRHIVCRALACSQGLVLHYMWNYTTDATVHDMAKSQGRAYSPGVKRKGPVQLDRPPLLGLCDLEFCAPASLNISEC